jgi:hypothetical protein
MSLLWLALFLRGSSPVSVRVFAVITVFISNVSKTEDCERARAVRRRVARSRSTQRLAIASACHVAAASLGIKIRAGRGGLVRLIRQIQRSSSPERSPIGYDDWVVYPIARGWCRTFIFTST